MTVHYERRLGEASAGMLVLGMHRSGTSVLARALQLGGANIGDRLIEGSAGNESGHWEDAFAVETHERLLAQTGRRWNDLVPMPKDWIESEAAVETTRLIREYIRNDRANHPLWAVKDPRLCEFGALWRKEAVAAGLSVGAIVVVRHPWEVARSLATRDGMLAGQAMLLWLDYTLGALAVADGLPTVVVSYSSFLEDWRNVVGRIKSLPGGASLSWNNAVSAQLDQFVSAEHRHHREQHEAGSLPKIVSDLWACLVDCADSGLQPDGLPALFAPQLAQVRELLTPLVSDWRVTERKLWERVSRAEDKVGKVPSSSDFETSQLPELIAGAHSDLVRIYSEDIRRMQDTVSAALDRAARNEVRAGVSALFDQTFQAQMTALGDFVLALQGQVDNVLRVVGSRGEASLVATREVADMTVQLASDLKQSVGGELSEASKWREQQGGVITALRITQSSIERSLTSELIPLVKSVVRQTNELQRQHALTARIEEVIAEAATIRLHLESAQALLRSSDERCAELDSQVHSLEGELRESQESVERLESRIAAADVEFVQLHANLRSLRQARDTLDRFMKSRSWRWTRPMRALSRALRGRWTSEDSKRVVQMFRGLLQRRRGSASPNSPAVIEFAKPEVGGVLSHRPALAMEPGVGGLADVFVWAVIDWDFRFQRPQHLAKALAERGHRVFYVSNNFDDSAEAGFRAAPLDRSERLFQVHLNLEGAPAIYFGLPTPSQLAALRASLATLLAWTQSAACLSLVQHPYWSGLVRAVPNARVIYDCMDHHGGFENNASSILAAERHLVTDSDLVIVTSLWLEQEVGPSARACTIIRNACEFDAFSDRPDGVFRDERGRKVIGYYGAIAEWFDIELVRKVALAYPDSLVLLVGGDTIAAGEKCADLPNVRLTGEVRYAELPFWLYAFDVALLPFKVIPLTLATNPVKIYEFLAAGRDVVSVDLPEMAQFQGLIRVAPDHDSFVTQVGLGLMQKQSDALLAERQEFAAGQTWGHRAHALDDAIAAIQEPLVSIVVLTYNNLAYTDACLFSIESYSDYRNLEVIVVDNASSDGSPEWLQAWECQPSAAGHQRRLILNQDNLGFAAGNNVGLAAAKGDVLVLLNNDTYVTRGWVRKLCAHLRRDPGLGLLGPVTNNIGNEAKLDIAYADIIDMHRAAGVHTRAHPGETTPMHNAAFFCVAMRREVYEVVGSLDEAFGIGFFEDDDYCRRVQRAGWSIACAEDVFVHHHLSASFDQLKGEAKKDLFERNKAIYEAKWGPWQPHVYRTRESTETTQ